MEAAETITKEDLIDRIEDWKQRISDLYKKVKEWLPQNAGYGIRFEKSISMYEELMEKYHIDPVALDTADILKDGQIVLTIKPYGLWLIGANGRLDLLNKKGVNYLVDLSEKFQAPNWMLVEPSKKIGKIPFSKSELMKIIGNQ
jgi:hypothetical protein